MIVLLYVAAIVAANVVTARTVPADIGPFLVAWGTWFIAVTFVLRDVIQLRYGRRAAYEAIGVALVASALTSAVLGDTLAVVTASALAFAVSESLDTEVFTRLRARVPARIAVSGLLGGAADAVIFVVVGLSPLWSGIIPWSAVPNAILGQYIVKALVQLVAAGGWRVARGPEPMPSSAR